MPLFQGVEEAGRLRPGGLHGRGESGLLVAVRADLEGLCLEGPEAGAVHSDGLGGHGVVGDLHFGPDQRRLRLVLPALEADAPAFVNLALLVVEERLGDDAGVEEHERPAVAVELLHGGDPLLRDRHAQALIILPDAAVGLLVVVFLDEDPPIAVQLIQRADLLCLRLGQEGVADLVEFLNALSEYSDNAFYPHLFIIRTF